MNTTTSHLIRRLMDLGLSQREIRQRTGIQQPTLSKWMSRGSRAGDDALRLLQLCQLAEQGDLPPPPPPGQSTRAAAPPPLNPASAIAS